LPDEIRRTAEGSGVDDRVGRVDVHIEHRRGDYVDATGTRLGGGDRGGLAHQRHVARGTQGHRRGEVGATAHHQAHAGLGVHADEQRAYRRRLQPVDDGGGDGGTGHLGGEQPDAADPARSRRRLRRGNVRIAADKSPDQLPDQFVKHRRSSQ